MEDVLYMSLMLYEVLRVVSFWFWAALLWAFAGLIRLSVDGV